MKKLLKITLKWVSKLLANANFWYEKLEEPKRFIVAIIYGLFPFMFFAGLGAAGGQGGFYIIGLLWVAIFVIALRVWWLYGNLKQFLEY